jgi:hypothetical protein
MDTPNVFGGGDREDVLKRNRDAWRRQIGSRPVRRVNAIMVVLLLGAGSAACGGGSTSASSEPAGATGAAGPSATAADAHAEIAARKAQAAMEVYAIDNGGSYQGADAATLRKIEPSLPADLDIQGDASSYTITAHSGSGGSFTLTRAPGGGTKHTCTKPGVGACSVRGSW